MFNFIGNFFSGTWAKLQLTEEEIYWMILTVLGVTIIGIVPAFCGTPIKHSFYLSFPLWLFSAYRIFGLERYIRVAIAGEAVDVFQTVCEEKENESIWDSELAAKYRQVAINIWLAQTIIFLAAPLYFNFTDGGRIWLPILVMVVFAIAMISIKAGKAVFDTIAVVTIIFFLVFAVHDIFPQVSMIPGVAELSAKLKAGKMAGENARAMEDIGVIREKQRQADLSEVIDKTAKWQIENPGRDIPEEFKKEMEAAKAGMDADEYRIRKSPREDVAKGIESLLKSGKIKKVADLDKNGPDNFYQEVWAEYQVKLAAEKAVAQKAVVASASAPQSVVPQPPPQAEVATVPVVPEGPRLGRYEMEIGHPNGQTLRHSATLDCLDDEKIEVRQYWPDGHKVLYRGQMNGKVYVGKYRHTLSDDRVEEDEFEINSSTLRGRFKQDNSWVYFKMVPRG